MKRCPSGVQKCTPLARATGIGSTAPCAAHSEIVCFFDRAMISSLVMEVILVGLDLDPCRSGPGSLSVWTWILVGRDLRSLSVWTWILVGRDLRSLSVGTCDPCRSGPAIPVGRDLRSLS